MWGRRDEMAYRGEGSGRKLKLNHWSSFLVVGVGIGSVLNVGMIYSQVRSWP